MKESFVHRIKIAALLCRYLHGYTNTVGFFWTNVIDEQLLLL